VFEVQPNIPMIVIVGGVGHAGKTYDFSFGFGNTGGAGLSGVFQGPDTIQAASYDKAYIVAGGGGGAGVVPGGGPCIDGGPGNHANAGGMPDMLGGLGKDSGVNGGGGGYRGGLGADKGKAGTGGTGFVYGLTPSGASHPEVKLVDGLLRNVNAGDTSPPATADPDYDGKAGKMESAGQVVLHFTCQKPTITPK
jgi:hypothetical protein